MTYSTDHVKNLALAGHGGTGKTTLFERLLFAGGAISKPETVESGKTVSDCLPEEIERKISIAASLAHVEWQGSKINLIDTPGSSDFVGDVILSFRSAELVLLTVAARAGVQIETIKLWRNLDSRGKPRALYISRMDEEGADMATVCADIKEKLGMEPVPVTLPMGSGSSYKGVIDVLNQKAWFVTDNGLEQAGEIPAEYAEDVKAARERLIEAAAEGDDTLMDHYINQGSLDAEEMHTGLIEALAENKYLPAFCGVPTLNSGLVPLLDFVADAGPDPRTTCDIVRDPDGSQRDVKVDPDKPFAAIVIKTQYDQFSGKLSWIKVVKGSLCADTEVFNSTENKKDKIGKLYVAVGKKLEEVKELVAGDIGIVQKVASLRTSDTITAPDAPITFVPLRLPTPVHSVAVSAEQKKDEDKLGEALLRVAEEDNTFTYSFNAETHETIIRGMGELHINIILDRIKKNQKIDIITRIPRVAYRETIGSRAAAEYTHKKQTGGHGQYARVALEIAPLPRGEQYRFVNAVFGGAISKGYIPGVEKGILDAMHAGVLAGYPVVDVEAKVTDGKEHPVDSSEMAFKLAARNAFREAMRNARPSLLEPVMKLTVFVEDKYLGDIMSDLSGRRGRILGQEPAGGGIEEIDALVPESELLRYSIDLRSMTSGTGSFSLEFDHYEPIAGKIADEIIKEAQATMKQDDDD